MVLNVIGLGLFIVEWEKMVNEALNSFSNYIEVLCITKNSSIIPENPTFEVAMASEEELKSISSLKNPNKSLIVLEKT